MTGTAPTAAPRAASRPAPRARTNTGPRSAASTMSMATAIWSARARRWRITRRRRSEAKVVIAMGGAQRDPIAKSSNSCNPGFRCDSPDDAAVRQRSASRPDQDRVPAPQPVIGQSGAAPPAMNRIVAAEIFGCARIALPNAVRDSRLPCIAHSGSRSSCISSVTGHSARPDTAGAGASASRSRMAPTSQ